MSHLKQHTKAKNKERAVYLLKIQAEDINGSIEGLNLGIPVTKEQLKNMLQTLELAIDRLQHE